MNWLLPPLGSDAVEIVAALDAAETVCASATKIGDGWFVDGEMIVRLDLALSVLRAEPPAENNR